MEALAKLYNKKIDWKLKRFYAVAFLLCYLFAAPLNNPLFAFIIASLYFIGFVGAARMWIAARTRGGFDLFLGFMLIVVAATWLEVLYAF